MDESDPAQRNQRQRLRHVMAVPVELGDGARGVTRDVSANGVYFECKGGLESGHRISFDILLDGPDPEERIRLRCDGAVVRVEALDGRVGVAATIASYSLNVEPT